MEGHWLIQLVSTAGGTAAGLSEWNTDSREFDPGPAEKVRQNQWRKCGVASPVPSAAQLLGRCCKQGNPSRPNPLSIEAESQPEPPN
jgi:hypothetical protein